jgi:hypothetical protein
MDVCHLTRKRYSRDKSYHVIWIGANEPRLSTWSFKALATFQLKRQRQRMLNFNIPAATVDLPDFLDPMLSYLEDTLPSPVYSFFINFLSHALALLTALFSLVTSLISTNPSTWDAQKILPPLISIFAAYLALLSLYRTTSWMFRTTIFFIKWGAILGVLIAGAGWFIGNANGNDLGNYGVISTIGGFVLDTMFSQGQNAAGGTRSKSKSKTRSRSRPAEKKKPKPWEPFKRHREWQHQDGAPADQAADAQKFIGDIVGAAGKVVRESGWWSIAKKIVEGTSGEDAEAEVAGGRKQASRKAKSKDSSSRSR